MPSLFQSVNQTSHLDPKGQQSQDTTFFDDFLSYTSGGMFTSVDNGAGGTVAWDGTALGYNGAGHNVKATSTATQWDYAGLQTTNKLFLPINTGSAMGCEGLLNWTSQASNNAAIYFGFMSTTGVPSASTAVPTASYSGAIIYRLSGDTQWRVQASNGSSKFNFTTTKADFLCPDGTYCLRVDFMPFTGSSQSLGAGTQCFAGFSINGVQVVDQNDLLIQAPVAYASLASMYMVALGQVTVAGSVAQSLYIDYMQLNVSRGLAIPNG